MRPCFKFSAAAETAEQTLSIYDEIGFWGVQASDFRSQLDAVQAKTLNVEINSPGGDVFAGLAIYNMLKASGKEIVVKVMGVAASAASLIAMAGDKIVMPKNTFMMVHNPWGVAIGNSSEMRETAEVLDKIGDSLLSTYVAKTGLEEDEVKTMLAKDTWMTADEALDKGFATEVTPEIKASAKFDMDRADLPEHIKAIYAAAKPPAKTDDEDDLGLPVNPVAKQVHQAAVDAGLNDHAEFLAVACETMEDATKRITAGVEITQICAYAKRPEEAAKLIREGKTVAEARAALIKAMADKDVHTDTTKPANSAATVTVKSSDQVFAERNARKGAQRKKD